MHFELSDFTQELERLGPFWFKALTLVSTQLLSAVCSSEGFFLWGGGGRRDQGNWDPRIYFIPFGVLARTLSNFLGSQVILGKWDSGYLNALSRAL